MDARLPVLFGALEQAGPNDAVLVEAEALPPARFGVAFRPLLAVNLAPCPCCAPRGRLASALAALFAARARGDVPFFDRIVAVLETRAAVGAVQLVLSADPFCASRFRLSS
ncbi:MAG: hypothetical protein JOY70_02470 [Acidisphaera sp.]|nr:hypothetical protein [Acidisphaera sp.]MBV9813382.1 hypothetical protein [Acetobacteraceae bacterium]